MDLRGLRSFVTLAKLNNITRTAETLHLSPAAVHKQLKNLEEELETRLYEKIGRRLRLTAAAHVLLPHATDLLLRYDATLTVLQEWKGLKTAIVRLGTGPGTSISILPELLVEFRAVHPDVEVVVETGNTTFLIQELSEGTLDVAIMVNPDPPNRDRLTVEASWDFSIVLVTASNDLPRRCSMKDLAAIPFILFKDGSQIEKGIDSYMSSLDFHPRVIMRFDNAEAIKAMLKIGVGISMLPRWAVEHEIQGGPLTMIEQIEPPLRSKIILAVRRGGYLPAAARALVDVARRHRSPSLCDSLASEAERKTPTAACAVRKPGPDRRPAQTPPARRPRRP